MRITLVYGTNVIYAIVRESDVLVCSPKKVTGCIVILIMVIQRPKEFSIKLCFTFERLLHKTPVLDRFNQMRNLIKLDKGTATRRINEKF